MYVVESIDIWGIPVAFQGLGCRAEASFHGID